jgi:hypothetical protein
MPEEECIKILCYVFTISFNPIIDINPFFIQLFVLKSKKNYYKISIHCQKLI